MSLTATETGNRRRIISIIQVVLFACAVIALVWVGLKLVGYSRAQQEYRDIQAAYASEDDYIDFTDLISSYPNTVAWIRVDDLPTINYPIMQGQDNEFYLHNNTAGEPSVDGSIFLDYRNTSATANPHALIYGHNMRDGSMFGTLKEFENEDFYRNGTGMFTIYTPAGKYRYQIFAVNIVDPDNETFMVGFTDKPVFGAFVDMLKQSSMYDTGVSVSEDDQVITLSTCSSANRLVVSAKRVAS